MIEAVGALANIVVEIVWSEWSPNDGHMVTYRIQLTDQAATRAGNTRMQIPLTDQLPAQAYAAEHFSVRMVPLAR